MNGRFKLVLFPVLILVVLFLNEDESSPGSAGEAAEV